MKFVVDEFPYYEELCPFWTMRYDNASNSLVHNAGEDEED